MSTTTTPRSALGSAAERLDAGALLSTHDIAIFVGVSPETAARMVREGRLPAPDIGRGPRQRWRARTVRAFLEGLSDKRMIDIK